jgi:hypothetical protein
MNHRAHLLHNYPQDGKPSGTINTKPGSTPTQSPKRQHGRSRLSPPTPRSPGPAVHPVTTTPPPPTSTHTTRTAHSQATTPTAQQVPPRAPRSRATKPWRGDCSRKSKRMGLRALGAHRMATTAAALHHSNSPEWAVQAPTASRASCHRAKRSAASSPRSRRSLPAVEVPDRLSNSTMAEVDILSKATASSR